MANVTVKDVSPPKVPEYEFTLTLTQQEAQDLYTLLYRHVSCPVLSSNKGLNNIMGGIKHAAPSVIDSGYALRNLRPGRQVIEYDSSI